MAEVVSTTTSQEPVSQLADRCAATWKLYGDIHHLLILKFAESDTYTEQVQQDLVLMFDHIENHVPDDEKPEPNEVGPRGVEEFLKQVCSNLGLDLTISINDGSTDPLCTLKEIWTATKHYILKGAPDLKEAILEIETRQACKVFPDRIALEMEHEMRIQFVPSAELDLQVPDVVMESNASDAGGGGGLGEKLAADIREEYAPDGPQFQAWKMHHQDQELPEAAGLKTLHAIEQIFSHIYESIPDDQLVDPESKADHVDFVLSVAAKLGLRYLIVPPRTEQTNEKVESVPRRSKPRKRVKDADPRSDDIKPIGSLIDYHRRSFREGLL